MLFPQHLITGHHRDTVPGADLSAEGAPNAPWQIDRARLHDLRVIGSGQCVDAVDGANHDTRLAPGAKVFIEKCQLFGNFLGHADLILAVPIQHTMPSQSNIQYTPCDTT